MSSDDEVWCVLIQADDTVSLLKNLTAEECRAVVQRVNGGDPWSSSAIYERVLAQLGAPSAHQQQAALAAFGRLGRQAANTGGWGVRRCEWWGSRGSDLEIWPKPADHDQRMADALHAVGLINATNAEIDKARRAA